MARSWQLTNFERIADYAVVETDGLPFDGVIAHDSRRVLLVGEIAHLSYRLQMLYLDNELRDRVAGIVKQYAEWVGVDYPLGVE